MFGAGALMWRLVDALLGRADDNRFGGPVDMNDIHRKRQGNEFLYHAAADADCKIQRRNRALIADLTRRGIAYGRKH